MKLFLLFLLPLASVPLCLADYQVDVDLGVLSNGVIEFTGTTAQLEIDPGPPPLTIGGRDNSSFPRGLDLDENLNWGREIVYRFELQEPSLITLTSLAIAGDPDFFLLDSLSTEFDPTLSKNVATGARGVAYLDEDPPISESFGGLRPGVYYLSVENFDGLDGNGSSGDASFSIGISVNSATRGNLAIDLGVLAVAKEPFAVDTLGSAFDTELAVYDSSGQLLAENNNVPDSTHSRLGFDQGLPAGSYSLVLAGSDVTFGPDLAVTPGGETGDWVLNFPPTAANSTGSEMEATVGGSETTESQLFQFIISDPPADFIDLGQIVLADESVSLDTFESSFDTVIGLFDRTGNFLTANDDSNESGQSELMFEQGLAAGDYFLAVGGFPTIFDEGYGAFMDPEETTTASGSIVLNYNNKGTAGVSNADIVSGTQQWFRFSVVEEFSENDSIEVVSIEFDPATQEFAIAWESDLPGPFNIYMGTDTELEAASRTATGLPDLVLAGVASPVVVPVPQENRGAKKLFVQVGR